MCVCRCPLKKLQKFERGQANILTKKVPPPLPLLYRYNDRVPTDRMKAFTMRLYQRFTSVLLKLFTTTDNIHYVNSLSLLYRLSNAQGTQFVACVFDDLSTYTLVKRYINATHKPIHTLHTSLYIRYTNAYSKHIYALCTLYHALYNSIKRYMYEHI